MITHSVRVLLLVLMLAATSGPQVCGDNPAAGKAEPAAPARDRGSLAAFLKARGYFEVPLVLTRMGHLDVEVKVNGETLLCILDTGAGGVLIDSAVIKRMKLPIQKTGKLNAGLGGAVPLEKAIVEQVSIGPCVSRMEALVGDLTAVNAEREKNGVKPCQGLVGFPFLRMHGAVIDYPSAKLFLLEPGAAIAAIFEIPGAAGKLHVQVNRSLKDIEMSYDVIVTLPADAGLVVTKGALEQLQNGMTYGKVGAVFGGDLSKGKLVAGYSGTWAVVQGKHRIDLVFKDGKVSSKSGQDLE
jgi:hypothetical protein